MGILSVFLVILALGLIILILLQHGKGADAGASFGGGGSASSVFGAQGSGSFLSRMTAILATLFFAVSLIMYIVAARHSKDIGEIGVATKSSGPAIPGTDAKKDQAPDKSDKKQDKKSDEIQIPK